LNTIIKYIQFYANCGRLHVQTSCIGDEEID